MSLIKANAVQIGQSPTATQNFTLAVPSSPDGTIKLARGNAGATTQDVMNVSNAGVVSFPQGLGNISNSTAIATGSTTARSLSNRFADVVNVKDFGAVGDGVADDTAAIQSAFNAGYNVVFPEGVYNVTSTLYIRPFLSIAGISQSASDPTTSTIRGGAKLVFFGTGTSCFAKQPIYNAINHFCVTNLTILTNTVGYDWIFDIPSLNESTFTNVRASNPTGGVLRVLEAPGIPAWVNRFTNCQFGVNQNGNSYVVDHLFSDSFVTNCYFSGGKGVIDRSGGNQYVNCIFDHSYVSGFAALNLQRGQAQLASNGSITSVTACYFEDIHTNCIILDASNVTANNTWHKVAISACTFRATEPTNADIYFKCSPTYVVKGVSVTGCALTIGRPSFEWSHPGMWTSTSLIGNSGSTSQYIDFTSPAHTIIDHTQGNTLNNMTRVTGYGSYYGKDFTSAIFSATSSTSTSCLLVGSTTGNVPFIAASNNSAGTASGIQFLTNNTARLAIEPTGEITASNVLMPQVDNSVSCGQSGNRWSAIWAANGTIQTSDERTKKDIANSELGLDFITSLRPVSYKWVEGGKKIIDRYYVDKDGNKIPDGEIVEGATEKIITESIPGERTHFGLISQEVKAALPDGVDFGGWVLTDKENPDSQQALRYDQFIAPLIKAVQELSQENALLKQRIEALESK
jgi:hypothetical protein